jgi:uncharacterized DUF497 family protein
MFGMDVHTLFRGQRFMWNVDKAATNESKHGVRFETAIEVFFDPLVRLEDAGIGDEARDAAVGFTEDWRLLFVVHLIREDDTIRIISARPATAEERRAYEDCE